jgi:hypothetical protein
VTASPAGLAPGVLRLRVSGAGADIDALAGLLAGLPAVQVLDRSAPYPNRRDPGERVYLTVQVSPPAAALCECNGGPACDCPGCDHRDCMYRQLPARPGGAR